MITSSNYYISPQGHLMVEGCDTTSLASEYGTPLYVVSESEFIGNICSFRKSINIYFNGKTKAAYAGKALLCKEIVKIIQNERMYLDVASEGELYTAVNTGFPCERIYFHGNNKLPRELAYAIDSKVGKVVVDNHYELNLLNEIAVSKGVVQDILLRIKPGVDTHTHVYVRTGGVDSKFGFGCDDQEIDDLINLIKTCKGVKLSGIHCHLGSQILDLKPYREAAKIMTDVYKYIFKNHNILLDEINLGGGFGIPYNENMTAPSFDRYMKNIFEVMKENLKENGLNIPYVTFEPGRSLIGTAGITLYTIGSIKHIENIRTYLAVDGGMPDNPRYALYKSSYMAEVANKADRIKDFQVTIAGKCCESGDLIQENIKIQQAESGDILAVMPTGAYNYSMASNYNRLLRPAMIMVSGQESKVIIKRENFDDIIQNDI